MAFYNSNKSILPDRANSCNSPSVPLAALQWPHRTTVVEGEFAGSDTLIEASDGKTAENVGSKTMRAEKFGRTGFQKVHRGNAQRGIRNSNTGHRFQARQGHLSLLGLSHSSVDAHGGLPRGLRPRRGGGGRFGRHPRYRRETPWRGRPRR